MMNKVEVKKVPKRVANKSSRKKITAKKKKPTLKVYNLYRVTLIMLLVVAVGFSGGWNISELLDNTPKKEITISIQDVTNLYADARYFTSENEGKLIIYNKHKDIIGYALSTHSYASDVKGFAGEVPLLISYNNDSIIHRMTLLQHNESDEYMEYIVDDKLLDSWNGLPFDRAMYLDVDGITSATETSDGIIETVQVTLSELTGKKLHKKGMSWLEIIQFVLSMATIIFGLIVCYYKPMKSYRTTLLVMVVIVLGFMYQKMISISLLHGWVIHGISISSNFISLVLIVLSLVLPLTTKKQFYCHYMCPFGAAQELAGKVSPFQKRNMNWLKVRSLPVQTVVSILLIGSILIGYYPELSYVEPFPSFSVRVVSGWMLGFGALFIGLSLFYSKPWCKVCPTGFVIDNFKKKNSRDTKEYKVL
ncbi:FMN-binding protein [Flammeovirga agarivorans]|uniref:4Fe-4S binding protein n=1 Tax=Flammeovirga agarivorans TaxID=2726742 RepID=A0A7X8XXY4_9BACT|nr:4Fe-4S binding protein [Flammeovirga agarivorans]NLR93515.1 4Fe-4S binding protein [Flammeovirga agarivorans]